MSDPPHTLATGTQGFDVEDAEFLRHGQVSLKARLYRPHGKGPFPAMVQLHGGIWTKSDRTRSKVLHEWLAGHGIAVASLDFRQGAGGYPAGLADINFAIRWLKANPARLNSRADLFGISGGSSGGHLAILAAMRPDDARYSAIPLPDGSPPLDANLRCVVMFWPVTNPLGRYHNARQLSMGANPPDWAKETMQLSLAYWQTEKRMSEGSPLLILERGEWVATPPALLIQETNDPKHDYPDSGPGFSGTAAQRFADRYARAGGEIKLTYYDAPLDFNTGEPPRPEAVEALESVVAFIHRQMPITD